MIYTTAFQFSIQASHTLPNPPCDKRCGHTWQVYVRIQGDPDPDISMMIAPEAEARAYIWKVLAEVDHRDMNDMIKPAIPSVNGFAAWIWERLALEYKLDEVRVWHEHAEGALRRDR